MEANVGFEREYTVDIRSLASEAHGRRFLRRDFVLDGLDDRIIILECSEHQHRGYDVKMESLRPLQIMKAFSLRGEQKPVVYINYNPHAFFIASKRYDPPRHLRFRRLKAAIDECYSSKDLSETPLSVLYLYYDVDENGDLTVAGTDAFDEWVRECIEEVIVDA
jgi:hypothetical protein